LAGFISSCNNTKRLENGKPLVRRSPGHLVNQLNKNSLIYDQLSFKAKVSAIIGDEKQDFKATIRIQKDSAISIGISPALGVEIVKVVITQDSLKYISRIPGDKHYFVGDFRGLNALIDGDFNYQMVQNMLTGEPVALNKKDDKLKSDVDGENYLLIQKYDRKLKRLTGMDEKEMDIERDTIFADTTSRAYNRITKRVDDYELLIKRYWLDGLTLKLTKTIFNDLLANRTVEITHKDYRLKESQLFPFLSRLVIQDPYQKSEIEAEITKTKFNKPYEIKFEVPEKFERRYYN
jgi:hypothetical protein